MDGWVGGRKGYNCSGGFSGRSGTHSMAKSYVHIEFAHQNDSLLPEIDSFTCHSFLDLSLVPDLSEERTIRTSLR